MPDLAQVPTFGDRIAQIHLSIDQGNKVIQSNRCRDRLSEQSNAGNGIVCKSLEQAAHMNNVRLQTAEEGLPNEFRSTPTAFIRGWTKVDRPRALPDAN